MVRPPRQRTCKHWKTCFAPDPRNVGHQHSGAKPPCRKASTAARPGRWLSTPAPHDSCRGPAHVERVRQWRQHHPGSWRRQASQASDAPEAFQAPCTPQGVEHQEVALPLEREV